MPDILDFAAIAPLMQKLKPAIAAKSDISIDASNIMRVSTSALQFLLTVAKQVQADGGSVSLDNPSEPLSKAVVLLGFDDAFSHYLKGWQR